MNISTRLLRSLSASMLFALLGSRVWGQPSATHQTAASYTAGATLTVTNTFSYSGTLLSLLWRPVLPSGWALVANGVSGSGTPELQFGEIVWVGALPASPVQMIYTVQVPAGAAGSQLIRGEVEYQFAGAPNPVLIYASPNPLVVNPVICQFTLSPAGWNAPAGGGSTNVSVTASLSSCAWDVTGVCGWLTVSPTSGTGNGTVAVSAAANNTGGSRNCTLTIAGQNFTVTQAPSVTGADLVLQNLTVMRPPDCTNRTFTAFSFTICNNGPVALLSENIIVECYLSDDSTFGDADDRKMGDFGLTLSLAPGECVTITLSPSGLAYMVAEWTQCLVPNGNYYVFARVRVSDGSPSDPTPGNDYDRTSATFSYCGCCAYAISPASGSIPCGGGSVTLNVATAGGCSWTVSNPCSWLTVSPSSGTGNGSVTLTAAANSGADRVCCLTIAGQQVCVTNQGCVPVAATHQIAARYIPGETLRVTNTFSYSGTLLSLLWRPVLPSGWALVANGVSGSGTPELQFGEIVWVGTLPASPVQMIYTVQVPTGAMGSQSIRGEVEYQFVGMANPAQVYAVPDPLDITAPPSVTIWTAVEVGWKSASGVSYQVQWSYDLTNGWRNLGTPVIGDGSTNTVFDSTRASRQKFYRVVVLP